jgi:hypothetical protein
MAFRNAWSKAASCLSTVGGDAVCEGCIPTNMMKLFSPPCSNTTPPSFLHYLSTPVPSKPHVNPPEARPPANN